MTVNASYHSCIVCKNPVMNTWGCHYCIDDGLGFCTHKTCQVGHDAESALELLAFIEIPELW